MWFYDQLGRWLKRRGGEKGKKRRRRIGRRKRERERRKRRNEKEERGKRIKEDIGDGVKIMYISDEGIDKSDTKGVITLPLILA